MRDFFSLLASLGLLLSLNMPAQAQQPNNDGFYRHNGQMHILRNGQLRPMTRDSHLPTGVVVTKDGFVVDAQGRRTQLREGQGCNLKGNVVAVKSAAGGLALAAPPAQNTRPVATEARTVVADLPGGWRAEERNQERDDHYEDDGKYEEKYREQRKKEEEWQRESEKKREEHDRKREKKEKKWKEKHGKGKRWDD
jgi:hypothetical protein